MSTLSKVPRSLVRKRHAAQYVCITPRSYTRMRLPQLFRLDSLRGWCSPHFPRSSGERLLQMVLSLTQTFAPREQALNKTPVDRRHGDWRPQAGHSFRTGRRTQLRITNHQIGQDEGPAKQSRRLFSKRTSG
jgi:hypothetical protein